MLKQSMMNDQKKDIENRQYDVIVVIGNGFDLNLGLKTRYADFINSELFQNKKSDYKLFQHLDVKNIENKGWIDAEIELKIYAETKPNNYFEEFQSLTNTLTEYLNNETNEQSDIYKKIYTNSSKAKDLLDNIKSMNFLILNFNYTTSCEDLFFHLYNGNNSLHHNAKKRIVHVHGSIIENNIIFGVEDGARIDEEYIFLKKSVFPNFCILNIEELLIKNTNNIIFFGYSLGITDYTYLKKFFYSLSVHNHRKNIYIKHYGMDSYYDIHKRIDEMSSRSISRIKQNNVLTFSNLKND